MSKLRQIIHLKSQGYTNRKIYLDTGISRRTINKYVKLIDYCGLSYVELMKLEEAELNDLMDPPSKYTQKDPAKYEKLSVFFPHMEKDLKRVGVTKWLLWAEYRQQDSSGYEYSTFCKLYSTWLKGNDVSMHMEYKAGDKMAVDYAGAKIPFINVQTGEECQANIFVAILGASQYAYVEATSTQKKEDFISSLENALIYFGGVPNGIVCDNLRSGVDKASRYEPKINQTLEDFALHYNTAVLPTRPRKPKDKGNVERAVGIVYNRIYAPLRNRRFFSLQELNQAIGVQLEEYNTWKFQGRSISRKDLYEQIEKPVLHPLPNTGYELKNYCWATVQKNSHILLGIDKHYYSVPYQYLGKKVKVSYCTSAVEIYYNYNRIASHKRNYVMYKYTTVRDHVPSSHNYVNDWSAEYFTEWAKGVGRNAEVLILKLIDSKRHPEQAYKACLGVLQLAKKVGKDRLDKACFRALHFESYSYHTVKNILDKDLDKMEILEEAEKTIQIALSFHENIRGAKYYQ